MFPKSLPPPQQIHIWLICYGKTQTSCKFILPPEVMWSEWELPGSFSQNAGLCLFSTCGWIPQGNENSSNKQSPFPIILHTRSLILRNDPSGTTGLLRVLAFSTDSIFILAETLYVLMSIPEVRFSYIGC